MSGDKFNTEAEQGVDVVLGSLPAQDSAHTAPSTSAVWDQGLPQVARSPPLPAQTSAHVPTPLTHTAEDTATRDQEPIQGATRQPYSSMPSQISAETLSPTPSTASASTGIQELRQGTIPPPFNPTPARINAHTPSPSPTAAADWMARSQEPIQGAMTGPYSPTTAQVTAQAPVPTHPTSAASTGSQELPQAAMPPQFDSIPIINARAPAPTTAAFDSMPPQVPPHTAAATGGTFLPEGTRVRRRHVIERAEFTLPNGQGVNVTSESLLKLILHRSDTVIF